MWPLWLKWPSPVENKGKRGCLTSGEKHVHVTVMVEVWPSWLISDNSSSPWYTWSVSKKATISCDRHGWNGKTWRTFFVQKPLFYAVCGEKREGGHVTMMVEIFWRCDHDSWNSCDRHGWNKKLSTKYQQTYTQGYPQVRGDSFTVIWVIKVYKVNHSYSFINP